MVEPDQGGPQQADARITGVTDDDPGATDDDEGT
jgi:hypothetical protein